MCVWLPVCHCQLALVKAEVVWWVSAGCCLPTIVAVNEFIGLLRCIKKKKKLMLYLYYQSVRICQI